MDLAVCIRIAVGKFNRLSALKLPAVSTIPLAKPKLRPHQIRIRCGSSSQVFHLYIQSLARPVPGHQYTGGRQPPHCLNRHVIHQSRSSGSCDKPGGILLAQDIDQALRKTVRILQARRWGIAAIVIIQIQNLVTDSPVRLLLPPQLGNRALLSPYLRICTGSHLLNDRVTVNAGCHAAVASQRSIAKTVGCWWYTGHFIAPFSSTRFSSEMKSSEKNHF